MIKRSGYTGVPPLPANYEPGKDQLIVEITVYFLAGK